jgi:hypothetical protein
LLTCHNHCCCSLHCLVHQSPALYHCSHRIMGTCRCSVIGSIMLFNSNRIRIELRSVDTGLIREFMLSSEKVATKQFPKGWVEASDSGEDFYHSGTTRNQPIYARRPS